MSNSNGKWLLAVVALCCLTPTAFARRERPRRDPDGVCTAPNVRSCTQVPEGGSTAIYLLGAGLTCFGAMFLRSKIVKPAQS